MRGDEEVVELSNADGSAFIAYIPDHAPSGRKAHKMRLLQNNFITQEAPPRRLR